MPAGGLRERIEQQRPITALRLTILLLEACNRPIWLIGHRFGRSSLVHGSCDESFGINATNAAIGVLSVSGWPCGQNSQPKPECHQRRVCATRREVGVTGFDCGVGVRTSGRYPVGSVAASLDLIERSRGFSPLPSARTQQRDWKAQTRMTRTRQELAARRRGELNRDRGLRRLSQAVHAQRRLNARRADGALTTADPHGPSDPRHAYLTRSHD